MTSFDIASNTTYAYSPCEDSLVNESYNIGIDGFNLFGEEANIPMIAEKSLRMTQAILSMATVGSKSSLGTLIDRIDLSRDALFSHAIINRMYLASQKGLSAFNIFNEDTSNMSYLESAAYRTSAITEFVVDVGTPAYVAATLIGSAAAAPIGTYLVSIWIVNAASNLVGPIMNPQETSLKDWIFNSADLVLSLYSGYSLPQKEVIKPAMQFLTGAIGFSNVWPGINVEVDTANLRGSTATA